MSDDIDPKAMEIAYLCHPGCVEFGLSGCIPCGDMRARAITALLRERDEEIAEVRACFEHDNAKWGQAILRAEAAEAREQRALGEMIEERRLRNAAEAREKRLREALEHLATYALEVGTLPSIRLQIVSRIAREALAEDGSNG